MLTSVTLNKSLPFPFWAKGLRNDCYADNYVHGANRMAEIQELTKVKDQFHVEKKSISKFIFRGQCLNQFLDNKIKLKGIDWRRAKGNGQIEINDYSKGNPVVVLPAKIKQWFGLWERYLSPKNLVRYVADFLCIVDNFREPTKLSGLLFVNQLHQAWKRAITLAQQEVFDEEIKKLSKNEEIAAISKIKKLCPVL